MIWVTHFLFSFFLLSFFESDLTIITILSLFSILPDLDFLTLRFLKKGNQRTFIQEPFGIILIGLPLSSLFLVVDQKYVLFAFIAWSSHILLDYITKHTVYPFAPFSRKKFRVGFIQKLTVGEFAINFLLVALIIL